MTYWKDRSVLVTGGAGFIGAHLVEALTGKRAKVRVAIISSAANTFSEAMSISETKTSATRWPASASAETSRSFSISLPK